MTDKAVSCSSHFMSSVWKVDWTYSAAPGANMGPFLRLISRSLLLATGVIPDCSQGKDRRQTSTNSNHIFKTGKSDWLNTCMLDCRFGSADAAGESISVRCVWVIPMLHNMWDRLTCGVGERDADQEGQGLQLCISCKCNANASQFWFVIFSPLETGVIMWLHFSAIQV